MPKMNLSSTSLKNHLPIFEKKLGPNKPLTGLASFKDINVMFGKFDTDIIIEYTVCFSLRVDVSGSPELIYDELKMVTSAKVRADDDIVYITLLKNKLFIDNQYG